MLRDANLRFAPQHETSILSSLRGELFGLGHGLLDRADHVKRSLRQMVVLALAQTLEALDGVGEIDELARRTGEHLGHMEGLRQEALDLAGSGHCDLVLFGKLVYAENGDD